MATDYDPNKTLLFNKVTYNSTQTFQTKPFVSQGVAMLIVIPVFRFPSTSFIGTQRASDLPYGLNTIFVTALAKMEECGIKPSMIAFGNEEDCRLRAQEAILQLDDGNAPASEYLARLPIDAWARFLALHDWWSKPHWTDRIADNRDHHAQCTDCGKTTKGAEWPEKCPNPNCVSHAKWIAVKGEIAKL